MPLTQTTIELPNHLTQYSKVYNIEGKRYVQVQHAKTLAYLEVDPGNSLTGLTMDGRDNSTFFEVHHMRGYSYLENVLTCLFICLEPEKSIYTSQKISKKDSCRLRFHSKTFEPGSTSTKTTNLMLKQAEIKSLQNETHKLVITVEHKKKSTHFGSKQIKLSSKVIPIAEGDSDNFFIIKPVKFELLADKISSNYLQYVYRGDIRFKSYCPTVHQRQAMKKENQKLANTRSNRHADADTVTLRILSSKEYFSRSLNQFGHKLRPSCRNGFKTDCLKTHPVETSKLHNNQTSKKNCEMLDEKNGNKKHCLRHKRKLCRQKVAERHPDWTMGTVIQNCKKPSRKQLKRCAQSKMKKTAHLNIKSAMKLCRQRKMRKFN